MTIKKIVFLFLITLSSISFASNYDGYFIDEKLDYPAFLGECSALLAIYMNSGKKQEIYYNNYQKYIALINNLDNNEDKQRSFDFQDNFIDEISKITSPNEEQYWGLRNDMSACAYWAGFKKNHYKNNFEY